MKFFKGLLFILGVISLSSLTSCNDKSADIIATNYVGYDFAKNICKDTDTTVSMLLEPGAEIHGYEPSTKDIRNILNSKVFIYVGGESDVEWVEKSILPQIDKNKTQIVSMFDALSEDDLYEEEEFEDEEEHKHENEEEHEYDEHVWNDYDNAKMILNAIRDAIIKSDSKNEAKYKENAINYYNAIEAEQVKLEDLLENKEEKYMLVADRFPLLYFVKEYDFIFDAALSGCSTAKETSANTLIRLRNNVEFKRLKYIFVIELSTQNIAKALKQEIKSDIDKGEYSGVEPEILTFYSMHNISKDDFNKGLTFVDFMKKNYDTLNTYFSD